MRDSEGIEMCFPLDRSDQPINFAWYTKIIKLVHQLISITHFNIFFLNSFPSISNIHSYLDSEIPWGCMLLYLHIKMFCKSKWQKLGTTFTETVVWASHIINSDNIQLYTSDVFENDPDFGHV